MTKLISKILEKGFVLPTVLGDFMRRSNGEPIFNNLEAEQKSYVRYYREASYLELVALLESFGLVNASTHPDVVQSCLRDLIKGEILNKKDKS